jgi:hypothetical protein
MLLLCITSVRTVSRFLKLIWRNIKKSMALFIILMQQSRLYKRRHHAVMPSNFIHMYVCICRGGFSPCTATLYGLLYVPDGYSNRRHAYTPGQPASSTYQRTAELTPLKVTWSTSWTGNVRNLAQRFLLGTWGSSTCSKSTTRVKQLKVPSEGLCSRIFPS